MMTPSVRLAWGAGVGLVFVVVATVGVAHRDRPGTLSFAALSLLFGGYALLPALPSAGLSTVTVQAGVLEYITVFWAIFVCRYTGRGPALSRPLLAGLVGFLFLLMLGLTGSSFVPSDLLDVLFTANFVLQSLSYAVGVYGLAVVSRSVFVYDDLSTGGSVVLVTVGAGFVCLSVLLVAQNVVGSRLTRDATLIVLSLLALSVLAAVVRFQLFTGGASTGHLTREQVLDEMNAAVVIADRSDRILECNTVCERLFGIDRNRVIGERLDTVTGPLSAGTLTLSTTDGARRCVVERTALTATTTAQIGVAYRIRDVTDRVTREQRLDVLNRVLRHNLRNDLDAMRAFAETLQRDEDVETAEVAEQIETTATELSAIGATVERCEQLLGRERHTDTTVDLTATAREIAQRLSDQYPGTATVRPDGAQPIRTDPAWIEAILSEVVENGLKHGPGADARVEVVIEPVSDAVEITVRDNGPGIPAREQAVLLDGEESPLRHGSGLGLWLVNWGLSRLGGRLSFQEPDGGGSVVTLTIPDASESP